MSRAQPFPGYAQPTAEESAALDAKLVRERAWYADVPRYATNYDIRAAAASGELIELTNTHDIQRIGRFDREPDMYLPYLTPTAHRMANDFGRLWRMVLREDGVQHDLDRLAATSLVRSLAYQAQIVRQGALAAPDSTHCAANAVDFDAAGYYRQDADGLLVPHGHPERLERHRELATRIGRPVTELGVYDPHITDAAIHVARVMHQAGLINYVEEFPGTSNACMHLAVAPDYPDTAFDVLTERDVLADFSITD